MEGLEALKDLRNCLQAYYTMDNVPSIDNNLDIIETELERLKELEKAFDNLVKENEKLKNHAVEVVKEFFGEELKALEIIKERECIFKGLSLVSQEEFDLLKEVLL